MSQTEIPEKQDNSSSYSKNESAQALAVTATFIGLASIGASFVMPVLVPLILAPIAVVLAVLSKGAGRTFSPAARRAVIFAAVGIGVNLLITVFTFRSALQLMKEPAYREQLNHMTENMYGYTYDELIENLDAAYGLHLSDLFAAE